MARAPPNSRETQLARFVLSKILKVRAGENVVVEGWTHTLPWATAIAREARRMKAFPIVLHEDEVSFWDSVDANEDSTLGAAPTHEWAMLGKTDVYIHMWGAGNRIRLNTLPDKRVEKIQGFNMKWYGAATKAGLRGTRLEVGRPFPNLAAAYGVDEQKWMDTLVDATMVDPARLRAVGAPIMKALERGRTVRIWDDHGTDLTLGLKHRKASIQTGEVTEKDKTGPFGMLSLVPTGVVQVALDENVADGTFVANRTSYFETGRATGGVFEFKDGKLIGHHYDQGSEFFDDDYKKAGKGRDQPGRLTIGLNPKLHDTPQLEDREAGAVLISVGGNNFLNGGKNKARFGGIVVNKGVHVEIDGRPLRLPK